MKTYELKQENPSGNFEEPGRIYNLEEHTFKFAQAVRRLVRRIPADICNRQDLPQLVRASGSVGANYSEANEPVSTKDFYYRIRICRKEAKESRYFLSLLIDGTPNESEKTRLELIQESTELISIFSSMIKKDPNR